MKINVAIDGPAGAGKSTIAKIVASKKNFIYVDTGAMYRAVAVYMISKAVNKDDTAKIAAESVNANVTIKYVDGVQRVFLNDEDVTSKLREEAVGNMASVVSAVPEVRANLLNLQRTLAKENDVVMDGRDIGTTILPDASLKIYLTASSYVRAKRRYDELICKGESADIVQIEEDIKERDYRDMHRDVSPLKQAEDAIVIDSSDMSIDEVADKILSMIG